ncbi:MAG: hypothetical protein QOE09_1698 [Ilumatobacteraceae bacterium]|jgi:uncharacterized membrane protein HdeD (DUF308 family)
MLTFRLGVDDLDSAARRVASRWWWYVLGGLAVMVVGVLLLANIFDAVATLALLVAIALAFQGVDEIVNAPRYRPRWPGYLLGVLYLITAALAAAWPGITLWALAVVVGVGFIVTGLVELFIVVRFHHDLPYRRGFIALAVMAVVVGVLALVWPAATVLVLAILLGVRVFIEGLVLMMFGLGLRRLATV